MDDLIYRNRMNAWVHEYADLLYRFCCSRIPDKHLARDMVQESFLSAWKNRAQFKEELSPRNWLLSILNHKIIDWYRSQSRKLSTSIEVPSEADDPFFDGEGHWAEGNYPVSWNKADQAIHNRELGDALQNCLAHLPEQHRQMMELKYNEDMSSEEICNLFQISSSNYWVILHRSKTKLRACLEKKWFLS